MSKRKNDSKSPQLVQQQVQPELAEPAKRKSATKTKKTSAMPKHTVPIKAKTTKSAYQALPKPTVPAKNKKPSKAWSPQKINTQLTPPPTVQRTPKVPKLSSFSASKHARGAKRSSAKKSTIRIARELSEQFHHDF